MSLDMKRLSEVEDKIEWVMKAFSVQEVGNPFARPHTFLEEYNRQRNEKLVTVTDGEVVDVVDVIPPTPEEK